MKNKTGHKIAGLTLMTIMLAGGMSIAFPGFLPDAHAVHANLPVPAEDAGSLVAVDLFPDNSPSQVLVSAEDAGSFVAGPQVVEILVIDKSLASGALPDVTVNGHTVVMTAATDGNWYAYIADNDSIAAISGTQDAQESNPGLNFGDNDNCTVANTGAADVYCAGAGANAVRSAKTPADTDVRANWPFIQTYAFPSDIEVRYNDAGNVQTTTLAFDENAPGLSLNRSSYPPGAAVHVTIEDHRLNIDPTSYDVWTWNENGAMYYGLVPSTDSQVMTLLADQQVNDACAGCDFSITHGRQDGSEPAILVTVDEGVDGLPLRASASEWFTVRETGGPNTAVFSATNPDDMSILKIADDAKRDSAAALTYDGGTTDMLVKHSTATIKILSPDGAWVPGSAVPVVVSDGDANKNSRAGDSISVSDINSIIPTMVTGDPFTLGEVSDEVVIWIVFTLDNDDPVAKDEYQRLIDSINDPDTADPSLYAYTHAYEAAFRLGGILPDANGDWQPLEDPNRHRVGIRAVITVEEVSHRGIISIPTEFTEKEIVSFSKMGVTDLTSVNAHILAFDFDNAGVDELQETFINSASGLDTGINTVNYNFESLGTDVARLVLRVGPTFFIPPISLGAQSGYTDIPPVLIGMLFDNPDTDEFDPPSGYTQLIVFFDKPGITVESGKEYPVVLDLFSFGFKNSGDAGGKGTANQVVRLELEESSPDMGSLGGTLEYVMLNQLNADDPDTYKGLVHVGNEAIFAVTGDLTGSEAPTVTYLDVDAASTLTQVSARQNAYGYPAGVSTDAEPSGAADTAVPSLERGPASNIRIVNAFGDSIDTVSVYQQVQVTYNLSNRQDRDQDFAYIVQIQDGDGVTVSLAWITGSLSSGQSFNSSASWMPTYAGMYTVTAFVWESVDNLTALSPPATININVN